MASIHTLTSSFMGDYTLEEAMIGFSLILAVFCSAATILKYREVLNAILSFITGSLPILWGIIVVVVVPLHFIGKAQGLIDIETTLLSESITGALWLSLFLISPVIGIAVGYLFLYIKSKMP